jgi:hypothetical protein
VFVFNFESATQSPNVYIRKLSSLTVRERQNVRVASTIVEDDVAALSWALDKLDAQLFERLA